MGIVLFSPEQKEVLRKFVVSVDLDDKGKWSEFAEYFEQKSKVLDSACKDYALIEVLNFIMSIPAVSEAYSAYCGSVDHLRKCDKEDIEDSCRASNGVDMDLEKFVWAFKVYQEWACSL